LLTIRVRGHFVMSVTKNHESPHVTVLDNEEDHTWCPEVFLSLQHIRSLIVERLPV